MVAISTSTVTPPAPVPPPQPKAQDKAAAETAAATANDPVDTVTLSDEAQQILDGQASAPAAAATPATDTPAAPTAPSQDQITAAVGALNDTSGATSLDDQLKAYALLVTVVAKGAVLSDHLLPPADLPAAGAIKASDATAVVSSAFSRRVDGVMAKVGADADPQTIASLSADDQQVYASAKALFDGLQSSATAPPTPGTAAPAATPPDASALMGALATLDDTRGAATVDQQLSALKLINSYAAAGDGVSSGLAVVLNANASAFAKHAAQTDTLVSRYLVPGDDNFSQMLDNLNKLSPEDQQTYFGITSTGTDGGALFASLDSEKQNLATRQTLKDVYKAVAKAYGVDSLSELTDLPSKNNPALQQLQNLMQMDQGNDGWTGMAQDFLHNVTPADLGLAVVDDDGTADMKKAMQTLSEVAADQTAFVKAVKAGKVDQWQAVTEAKKAKDKVEGPDAADQAIAAATGQVSGGSPAATGLVVNTAA